MTDRLSPPRLLLASWTASLGLAALVLSQPERFGLVRYFLQRQGLDIAAFGALGAAWIAVALLTYVVADFAARMALGRPGPPRLTADPDRAARLAVAVNLACLSVTLAWIGVVALRLGGVPALVHLALAESVVARDLLLENRLFTGMRLLYATLPGLACLSAALLATGRLSERGRTLCAAMLATNTAALVVLPVVMSQRLLLLQLVLSCWLVTCLVRGRLVGLRWIGLGAVAFLAVWTLREAVTNPTIAAPPLEIAVQKLAFYVVNDLWNSFAPLSADVPRTWGAVSFRGLAVLSFTDGWLDREMAGRLAALEAVRGGGEFSLLTAPFVDFGVIGGAALIACLAVAIRWVHHRGQGRLGWAVAYAQLGAGLLYSTHGLYATHQNLVFSVVVTGAILRLAGPARRAAAGTAAVPPRRHRRRARPRRAARPLPEAARHG